MEIISGADTFVESKSQEETAAAVVKGDSTLKTSGCKIDAVLIRELLNKGILIHARAVGPSMSPLITNGDRIYIERCPVGVLEIGDIVIYQDRRSYIVHRLVKKTRMNSIITRGDNVSWNDDPVPAENILGRVVKVQSRGRELCLTGRLSWLIAPAIARIAPSHVRGKRIIVRSLGRLWWIIGGRCKS